MIVGVKAGGKRYKSKLYSHNKVKRQMDAIKFERLPITVELEVDS